MKVRELIQEIYDLIQLISQYEDCYVKGKVFNKKEEVKKVAKKLINQINYHDLEHDYQHLSFDQLIASFTVAKIAEIPSKLHALHCVNAICKKMGVELQGPD